MTFQIIGKPYNQTIEIADAIVLDNKQNFDIIINVNDILLDQDEKRPEIDISYNIDDDHAIAEVTIEFSEFVHEFNLSDINLDNLGIVTFEGDGKIFQLKVSFIEDRDRLILIPENVAFDEAGNGNNSKLIRLEKIVVRQDDDGNKESINQAPLPPILIASTDEVISLQIIELKTDAFSDLDDDDFHSYTQWKISKTPDFSLIVYGFATDTHLTSTVVPNTVISPDTEYFWRCRFFDNHNNISEWSEIDRFETEPEK